MNADGAWRLKWKDKNGTKGTYVENKAVQCTVGRMKMRSIYIYIYMCVCVILYYIYGYNQMVS